MAKNRHKETIIGRVIEALPNATFRVEEGNNVILAHLAGKMRLYSIKVLVGDRVKVELDEYDKRKGRIVQRL